MPIYACLDIGLSRTGSNRFCYTRHRTSHAKQCALQPTNVGGRGGEYDVHGLWLWKRSDPRKNRRSSASCSAKMNRTTVDDQFAGRKRSRSRNRLNDWCHELKCTLVHPKLQEKAVDKIPLLFRNHEEILVISLKP